jgi:ABC-type transport system involved in cytochrome bd biosynthesis fused ATPase/permease subunit
LLAPSNAAYRRSARLLGVGASLVALALATLSALAITDLARHQIPRGIWLLVVLLSVRWGVGAALHEWDESVATRLRSAWRSSLVGSLALPRREGERGRSDLSLAIDHAATAPSLERLRASALSALLGLAIIFWAAGWLPFVITVALLSLAAPLYQRAGQRSAQMASAYQERRAVLEARQLEVLQHAPELRALGAVAYGASEIGAISQSEHTIGLRAVRVALESSLVTEFLSGVSIGLVAMVVGFALLDGHLSLLRALIAVLATSELFLHVRRFGIEFHRRDDAQVALTLLSALPLRSASRASDVLLRARGLVTEANPAAIELDLRPGDRVVITGSSGVGKSTLFDTLLGWRPSREGSVERTNAVVGYVSAESSLLSGSLRANLTLGSLHDDTALHDALSSLGLNGPRFRDLDVELLSDGRGMSSGERVRLVLTRVLLCSPALLLLDDIAGVLDDEARAHVRRTLAALPTLALIEATVDTALVTNATQRIEIR